MGALLSNFRNTLILSVGLAMLMIVGYAIHAGGMGALGATFADTTFWQAVFRWMHVVFGILWIGLLYYFNFVQIRVMPSIPAEQKPAVSKHIAPEALFWFRWSALFTVIAGLGIAILKSYQVENYALEVLTFGAYGGFSHGADAQYPLMGLGVWLAIIMFLNVWGIIWPNQKRALGIVAVDDARKAKAARVAMLGSRTNLLLSLPMLVAMAMNQTMFG